jgi:hypothetical protein
MRFVGRHVTEQRDLLLGGRTCWAKEDRRSQQQADSAASALNSEREVRPWFVASAG